MSFEDSATNTKMYFEPNLAELTATKRPSQYLTPFCLNHTSQQSQDQTPKEAYLVF